VNYLKPAFLALVKKLNISNEATLLKELKKKKYFVTESDRSTRRIKIDDKRVTYEFLIPVTDLKKWLH